MNGNSWYFNDEKVSDILDLIRKDTIPLKTLLDGIFQGVATGKDNVFILNKSFVEEHKIETDYLVKFLKGKDISPYKIEWKDNYFELEEEIKNRLNTIITNFYDSMKDDASVDLTRARTNRYLSRTIFIKY